MPSNKRKPVVVGLTGGIASGKSTVSKILKETYHCPVVDADQLAHAITAPGGEALPLIVRRFGEGVLTPDGALNRGLLRQRMTEDPEVKAALEAIQYPILQQVILDEIADHRRTGAPLIVYDCPMFFQTRQERYVDQVLVVICHTPVRIARLMARDGIDSKLAQKMLSLQMQDEEMIRRADWIVDNSRDEKTLEQNVEKFITEIL
ncbi:MAG: dephospho-CoA kinase [Pseudoramibacter sp.]